MARKSSMRKSGLNSLFRATQPARDEQEQKQGMDRDADQDSRETEDTRSGEVGSGVDPPAGEGESRAGAGRRRLIPPSRSFPAVIRVVGVGGAGVNAVNRMLEAGLEGVEFIAINTDVQSLQSCEADHKLRIGRDLTQGLGGGADPEIGKQAAHEARDDIKALLKGSDMVFVTAGEGGGTGTGAAPVIAEIARDVEALTIGVVSRPFSFEGRKRSKQADDGILELAHAVDTVIVVPNQKLLEVAERGTSMVEALRLADDVLRQGVQGICDLVTVPGLINLDLADVRTIMTDAGTAHMGIGMAQGEGRAEKATEVAINSSLLETSIQGARGILLNISGGEDLSLFEVNQVAELINHAADVEANIIFGAVVDDSLQEMLRVTVVATGFSGLSGEDTGTSAEDGTQTEKGGTSLPAPGEGAEERQEEDYNEGPEGDLDIPSFLQRKQDDDA